MSNKQGQKLKMADNRSNETQTYSAHGNTCNPASSKRSLDSVYRMDKTVPRTRL